MKKLICILCATFLLAGCFTGCTQGTEKVDPNKTQLYIDFYKSGFGSDWIDYAEEKFETLHPDVQVFVNKTDNSTAMQVSDLNSAKPSASIYFGLTALFNDAINVGSCADLSGLLEMKPDGETGKTIGEKVNDLDLWKKVGARADGTPGIYMLPNNEGFSGQVFDYDLFVDSGWLYYAENTDEVKTALTEQGITYLESLGRLIFESSEGRTNYTAGDYIMRAGKDGKYGTYDDGQPVTEQEYRSMLQKIKNDAGRPAYTWTGKHSLSYTQPTAQAVLAQYLGETGMKTYYEYTGSFTDVNGTVVNVTPKEGYKVFSMPEVKKTIEFVDSTFMNPEFYYEDAIDTGYSNNDAAGSFLLGHNKDKKDAPAMLFEGTWWENENKEVFNGLERGGEPEYGYGKRDYRYMLLPDLTGQSSEKSYFVSPETSAFVISAKQSEELLDLSMEFVALTLSDDCLKQFHKVTGVPRPYAYSTALTDSEYNTLTPFGRTVYEMKNDTVNLEFFKPNLIWASVPMNIAANRINDGEFRTKDASDRVYTNLFVGLQRISAQEYYEGVSRYYDPAEWERFYNTVKNQYE